MTKIPNADDVGSNKYIMSRKLSDPIENKEPIIKFIELNNCIIDDLHLFLRVSDKLFGLLLLKCIRLDRNSGEDLRLRQNLVVFLEFLEVKCKIKNAFYISNNKPEFGKILFRSFNGSERLKIFTELYEPKYDRKTKLKIQDTIFLANLPWPKPKNDADNFKRDDLLWLRFYNLYKNFKKFPLKSSLVERKDRISVINESLKFWLDDYKYVSKINKNTEKLSPYIHCLIFHYCQMLEIHGNIHIFSTQPNEKLNDFCTQYYHRCTNKNNNDKKYILQLLFKRNRIEFYNLDGDLEDFHASDEESDDE
jgi:hypothetical protein